MTDRYPLSPVVEQYHGGNTTVGVSSPWSSYLHAVGRDDDEFRTACGRRILGGWNWYLEWLPFAPLDEDGWAGGRKLCPACRRRWRLALDSTPTTNRRVCYPGSKQSDDQENL